MSYTTLGMFLKYPPTPYTHNKSKIARDMPDQGSQWQGKGITPCIFNTIANNCPPHFAIPNRRHQQTEGATIVVLNRIL